MRYFFLSFNYEHPTGFGFQNLTCAFTGHPTQKECKDALLLKMPHAKNIVLLGVTEFATKEDFETFKSEL